MTTTYIGKRYECKTGEGCIKHIFAGNKRIASKTASSTFFYLADHLGSRTGLTSALRAMARRSSYYPYGETRTEEVLDPETSKLHYMFTDQERDGETSLYYHGARYYDPAIGRSISADTIVQNDSDPQFLNRYSYVRNNPLRGTDPRVHHAGFCY